MKEVLNTLLVFSSIAFILGCSNNDVTFYQGYVEGEFVNIASSEGGRLEKLFVQRGQNISTGDPLFVLESVTEDSQLSRAKAKLEQSKANAQKSNLEFEKDKNLFAQNVLSKLEFEQITAKAKVDQNQVLADTATLKQAEWSLSQKALKSSSNALVYDTLYREGEFVPSANPIIRLLPPQNIKIRFFVPQSIATEITLNSKVIVEVYGVNEKISAIVNYVSQSAEYTSPLIYSNENAHKLVFMIEAKPDTKNIQALHPGQPVRVLIK